MLMVRIVDKAGDELMPAQYMAREPRPGETVAWSTDLVILDKPARIERREALGRVAWAVTLTAEPAAKPAAKRVGK